jgi:hypothetical protein
MRPRNSVGKASQQLLRLLAVLISGGLWSGKWDFNPKTE